MRGSLRAIAIGALVSALSLPASLDAQGGRQLRRGPGADREELEQRIRAQMGRMMRERLGLDEQQAERLSGVIQDFEGRRRELGRLEQATRRRVDALLRARSDDQQEASELLARMAELRADEAELFAAEQAALLDVLTPVQLLELQELREDLGRRIRALRGGRGDGRGTDRRRGR